ncbi:MAG TPA: hypothetical protein VNN22_08915 [Verrucomicrobiae bacterium]|nr:hypothetical protein [Verrucomicrobiae bacterium]
MPFHSLISADAYRDGGSLEAVFRTSAGKIDAICLKANILSHDGIGKLYSDAYWFRDESDQHRSFMNSLSSRVIIEVHSDAEKTLIAELNAFLANPLLEKFPHPTESPDNRLDIVRKLAVEIPKREHFDPAVHREAIKRWQDNLTRR